jgi:hypothetical protein
MVAQQWAAMSCGDSPMEVWKNKIRHLRNFFRGWARNQSNVYKKEKQRLLDLIDKLDIKAETFPLTVC